MLFGRTRTSSTPPPPDLETQARLHRDRMAGLWAAELLGLIGHAAHDYAQGIAQGHDHTKDGDDPVAGRLARDLRGKVGMAEIRDKLAHLLHEARRQMRD